MSNGNLILVLGDQLSPDIASLKVGDRRLDRVLIAEVQAEATYVKHHKKKIVFLFSAMRHFADELRASGWTVDYVSIDDAKNTSSLIGEVERAVEQWKPDNLIAMEPGEWRIWIDMQTWSDQLPCPVRILEDSQFLCSRREFADWADGRKQLRMEYFYREMRRKTGLLMEGDTPAGGRWNFDAENRKSAKTGTDMPQPLRFVPDALTRKVIGLVADRFADHFGDIEPFWFAVNGDQASAAFDHFLEKSLYSFGDNQDAMLTGERFLFHSVIAHYLNAGLLDPITICRKVEQEYVAGRVPLNSAEGFIRQIIGWREFVRGIYWLHMPDYIELNYFGATRPLPNFYWTGETDMNCLREAITQTKEEAYAHHIQRLMVIGNFAMLAGIAPNEVHEWYLSVYADAYEWVELPNTIGMSQYADGGLLGSKPYAASGNYISKMSDYCATCRYNVKQKTGEGACPFNPLYWHFLVKNEGRLRGNPRLTRVYQTWDRMSEDKQASYLRSADQVLKQL